MPVDSVLLSRGFDPGMSDSRRVEDQRSLLLAWVAQFKDLSKPTPADLDKITMSTPDLSIRERNEYFKRVCVAAVDPEEPAKDKMLRLWQNKNCQTVLIAMLCNKKAQSVRFEEWEKFFNDWRGEKATSLLLQGSNRVLFNRFNRFKTSSHGVYKDEGGVEVVHLQGLGVSVTNSTLIAEALQKFDLDPGNGSWVKSIEGFRKSSAHEDQGANGRCKLLIKRADSSASNLEALYLGRESLPWRHGSPSFAVARGAVGGGAQFALEARSEKEKSEFEFVMRWLLALGLTQSEILLSLAGMLIGQHGISGVAEVIPDPDAEHPRSVTTVFERLHGRQSRLNVNFSSITDIEEAHTFNGKSLLFDIGAWLKTAGPHPLPPPIDGLQVRLVFRRVNPCTEREASALASVVLRQAYREELAKVLQPVVDEMLQVEAGGEAMLLVERVLTTGLQHFLQHHMPDESLIRNVEVEIDTQDPACNLLIHILPFSEGTAIMSDIKQFALQLSFLFANRCVSPSNSPWLFHCPISSLLPGYAGKPTETSCELIRITFPSEVTLKAGAGRSFNRDRAHLVDRGRGTFGDADMQDPVLCKLAGLCRNHHQDMHTSLMLELAALSVQQRRRGNARAAQLARRHKPLDRTRLQHWAVPPSMPRELRLTDPALCPLFPGPSTADSPMGSIPKYEAIGPFCPAIQLLRLPPLDYEECELSQDYWAPVCVGCEEPIEHGYLHVTSKLCHCLRCFETVVAARVAIFNAQGLEGLRRSTPQLEEMPKAESLKVVGLSPGLVTETSLLHHSFVRELCSLTTADWSSRISLESMKRRLDLDLHQRASLHHDLSTGDPDALLRLKKSMHTYWASLFVFYQPHRRRWSQAAVQRARATVLHNADPPDTSDRPESGVAPGGHGAAGGSRNAPPGVRDAVERRAEDARSSQLQGRQSMGSGAADMEVDADAFNSGRPTGRGSLPGADDSPQTTTVVDRSAIAARGATRAQPTSSRRQPGESAEQMRAQGVLIGAAGVASTAAAPTLGDREGGDGVGRIGDDTSDGGSLRQPQPACSRGAAAEGMDTGASSHDSGRLASGGRTSGTDASRNLCRASASSHATLAIAAAVPPTSGHATESETRSAGMTSAIVAEYAPGPYQDAVAGDGCVDVVVEGGARATSEFDQIDLELLQCYRMMSRPCAAVTADDGVDTGVGSCTASAPPQGLERPPPAWSAVVRNEPGPTSTAQQEGAHNTPWRLCTAGDAAVAEIDDHGDAGDYTLPTEGMDTRNRRPLSGALQRKLAVKAALARSGKGVPVSSGRALRQMMQHREETGTPPVDARLGRRLLLLSLDKTRRSHSTRKDTRTLRNSVLRVAGHRQTSFVESKSDSESDSALATSRLLIQASRSGRGPSLLDALIPALPQGAGAVRRSSAPRQQTMLDPSIDPEGWPILPSDNRVLACPPVTLDRSVNTFDRAPGAMAAGRGPGVVPKSTMSPSPLHAAPSVQTASQPVVDRPPQGGRKKHPRTDRPRGQDKKRTGPRTDPSDSPAQAYPRSYTVSAGSRQSSTLASSSAVPPGSTPQPPASSEAGGRS